MPCNEYYAFLHRSKTKLISRDCSYNIIITYVSEDLETDHMTMRLDSPNEIEDNEQYCCFVHRAPSIINIHSFIAITGPQLVLAQCPTNSRSTSG